MNSKVLCMVLKNPYTTKKKLVSSVILISAKATFTASVVKFLNKSSETNFITPDHGCGQGYNEHISKVGKRESMIT